MAQFGAASISARSHESVAAGIITEHPVGKVKLVVAVSAAR
jgi:hypothetical protein